jgi:Domain of unknown function (DUF4173)
MPTLTKKTWFLFFVTGAILFNLLFWQEKMAFNALLFDVFLSALLGYLYPASFKKPQVVLVLLLHLVTAVALLWHNTTLSKIAFITSFCLLVGFMQYEVRAVIFAVSGMGANIFLAVAGLSEKMRWGKEGVASKKRRSRIGFVVLPLFIIVVFFAIYRASNAVFASFTNEAFKHFTYFFENFFTHFSFGRILFTLLGFYITAAIFLKSRSRAIENLEAKNTDDLLRHSSKGARSTGNIFYHFSVAITGKLAKGMLALKNEHTIATISLVLLNLLLLTVNGIDVYYLWFNFNYSPNTDLYTMIHEGADMLIVSVILAIIVLLLFFRGNLNFYKSNIWLKRFALVWVLQNLVLVVSVFLRDYYYIRELGLAHKRIGVLFFLTLVLVGLITAAIKIIRRKSAYYLFRINTWAVVLLLVAASCINWDVFIARYNIQHHQTTRLNIPYLVTLSDDILPAMKAHLAVLKQREAELNKQGYYIHMEDDKKKCSLCVEKTIKERIQQYLKAQKNYSWLSWNRKDAAAITYLTQNQ